MTDKNEKRIQQQQQQQKQQQKKKQNKNKTNKWNTFFIAYKNIVVYFFSYLFIILSFNTSFFYRIVMKIKIVN